MQAGCRLLSYSPERDPKNIKNEQEREGEEKFQLCLKQQPRNIFRWCWFIAPQPAASPPAGLFLPLLHKERPAAGVQGPSLPGVQL